MSEIFDMTITDYLKKIRDNAWNTAQLGREFEKFVKKFLLTEPSFKSQFSDVWLWSECPFAKGGDVGIDLVAKTFFGEYVAIQAKCYRPGTQVDKADVDTFLSASGRQIAPDGKATFYSSRIIIATNDNWTSHASEAIVGQQIPVTRIGLNQIQNAAIDWDRFFKGEKKVIVKKTLRPHQEAALKDVVEGFRKADRGQLIMACGTGKTFTLLKIAEAVCAGKFNAEKHRKNLGDLCVENNTGVERNGLVLFLVPSISLLGQSLREWCEQAESPLTAFAVCSDAKVTKDPDDTSLADLGFPATTSAAQLARYMRSLGGSRSCATADALERVPPAMNPLSGGSPSSATAYHPFDGIVLCDTFDLTEKNDALPGIFPENSERAARQKKLDIRVILGNPSYNVSKGTTYRNLEDRIAETYAQGTDAVNKNSLYDSYIKAFRWASDRIKDKGVVAFVTNGGWLDAQAMNGFRNSLVEEFDHIYVFNIRGNCRTQGELRRREGGNVFGLGSRTPVAITILVKTGEKAK